MRGVAITLGAAVLATAGWWLTSAALALLTVTFPFFLSIRATLLRDIQRD